MESSRTDLGSPVPWRRAQRAATARRAAAGVRRRRRGRARGLTVALTLGLLLAVPGALAAGAVVRKGDRGPGVARLQRSLHVSADGVFGPQTLRAVKRFQRRRGLAVDGIVGPATRRALGLRGRIGRVYHPRRRSRRGQRRHRRVGVPAILQRIAACESGGDPRAVSSDGTYRGKYQFDRGTWHAHGGRGDPARAPEHTQDRIALRLYRARGTAPWPVCGRA